MLQKLHTDINKFQRESLKTITRNT